MTRGTVRARIRMVVWPDGAWAIHPAEPQAFPKSEGIWAVNPLGAGLAWREYGIGESHCVVEADLPLPATVQGSVAA